MKRFFVSLLFCGLMAMTLTAFSQEIVRDNTERQETDDQLFEKYIQESKKLAEEFTPLCKQLLTEAIIEIGGQKITDYVRWEKEYYQPLFEKSKQAMERVTGTDDYLSMWENRIPQRLSANMAKWSKDKSSAEVQSTNIPYSNFTSLSAIYSLAICYERRHEILENTEYEDTEKGEERRNAKEEMLQKALQSDGMMGGMGASVQREKIQMLEQFKKLNLYYPFPPRFATPTTFDGSWDIMAIYSFKNDRARDLLFEMATRSDDKYDQFAGWANYYLSLFPNSGELLPKVKNLLNEANVSERLFDENGELIDSSLKQLSKFHSGIRKSDSIWLLLILKRSLDFNEKIPVEERERFDVFRRELAISWSLSNKRSAKAPVISATLQKEDEHFEIYFMEYGMPGFGTRNFLWEDDDDTLPRNPNIQQKRRAFYERERTHPRPIYTENQMEYLRGR